ncbi:hypothetical protein JCM8547_008856 [Rhodosporidiobolus lusitaniae]
MSSPFFAEEATLADTLVPSSALVQAEERARPSLPHDGIFFTGAVALAAISYVEHRQYVKERMAVPPVLKQLASLHFRVDEIPVDVLVLPNEDEKEGRDLVHYLVRKAEEALGESNLRSNEIVSRGMNNERIHFSMTTTVLSRTHIPAAPLYNTLQFPLPSTSHSASIKQQNAFILVVSGPFLAHHYLLILARYQPPKKLTPDSATEERKTLAAFFFLKSLLEIWDSSSVDMKDYLKLVESQAYADVLRAMGKEPVLARQVEEVQRFVVRYYHGKRAPFALAKMAAEYESRLEGMGTEGEAAARLAEKYEETLAFFAARFKEQDIGEPGINPHQILWKGMDHQTIDYTLSTTVLFPDRAPAPVLFRHLSLEVPAVSRRGNPTIRESSIFVASGPFLAHYFLHVLARHQPGRNEGKTLAAFFFLKSLLDLWRSSNADLGTYHKNLDVRTTAYTKVLQGAEKDPVLSRQVKEGEHFLAKYAQEKRAPFGLARMAAQYELKIEGRRADVEVVSALRERYEEALAFFFSRFKAAHVSQQKETPHSLGRFFPSSRRPLSSVVI